MDAPTVPPEQGHVVDSGVDAGYSSPHAKPLDWGWMDWRVCKNSLGVQSRVQWTPLGAEAKGQSGLTAPQEHAE